MHPRPTLLPLGPNLKDSNEERQASTTPIAPSDGVQTNVRIGISEKTPRAWVERSVTIPGASEPFVFGARPEFAHHYGVGHDEFPSRPATNDVFAAAVAACMAGTFIGTREIRGLSLTDDEVDENVEADMGPDPESGISIVRSIRVQFVVRVPEEQHELVNASTPSTTRRAGSRRRSSAPSARSQAIWCLGETRTPCRYSASRLLASRRVTGCSGATRRPRLSACGAGHLADITHALERN
jgi:hypothetical protein